MLVHIKLINIFNFEFPFDYEVYENTLDRLEMHCTIKSRKYNMLLLLIVQR